MTEIYNLQVKKQYAAVVIEELIKAGAVEVIEQKQAIKLTQHEKNMLNRELAAISANPTYLQKWDDERLRFKRTIGCIKEFKGVDFVVEPHVLTDEDQKVMSKIIADHKATGKITRAPRPKKSSGANKKIKR